MNWLKQLRQYSCAIGLSFIFLVTMNVHVKAQSENIRESHSVSISNTDEGKVKLKVIMKKGNDETTFEKTYDSYEDMRNDPDLDKYGININGFGFNGGSGQPRFHFRNGPGQSFWKESFEMDIDSLKNSVKGMIKGFGPGLFSFGFDEDNLIDMDSLMQRFNFRHDGGQFFFNGAPTVDLDSLSDVLKNKFGAMRFDFDDDAFNSFSFGRDDDDIKVISRLKVVVRSAKKEDQEFAGTDEMESLELRDINFYPNPSDGRFDVELQTGNDANIQVSIIDPEGNEIYNQLGRPNAGQYDFRVDLSHQKKGIYIMKVTQNNKALTKRVIIE